MALRGYGGIDPFFFGAGLNGDFQVGSEADLSGIGMATYKTLQFVKTSGGDPDYSVNMSGNIFIATRKIIVGPGVFVHANGRNGAGGVGTTGGAGGPAPVPGVLPGGYAGGNGGNENNTGAPGGGGTGSIGQSGGAGGASFGRVGGAAGLVSNDDLMGTEGDWNNLFQGHSIINGAIQKFMAGGGGGGGSADGTSAGGGGGGSGGMFVLAAPIIEIQGGGALYAVGGYGGDAEAGSASAGGGGAGAGGVIILIYGQLIVDGTINVDGGVGGTGHGTAFGGKKGKAGRIYHFGGTDDQIFRENGSDGSDGTP
jgi:hypothetical protein